MNDLVLFLDFDGVLHPDDVFLINGRPTLKAAGQLFMWVHYLEQVLDTFPNIAIVLSTSWVQWRSYRRTRNELPRGLRDRVIGATWHSRIDLLEWSTLTRYHEIRHYLASKPIAEWLALDDDDEGWPEFDRRRLIHTDPERGIGDENIRIQMQKLLTQTCVADETPQAGEI